jgi:hypothetical protein
MVSSVSSSDSGPSVVLRAAQKSSSVATALEPSEALDVLYRLSDGNNRLREA